MNEKLLEYFKSDDIHLVQCEHKWCNAYGYEKSQMKKDILDYITNLQQENERLKEDNLLIKSGNKLVSDKLQDYKSRCEKAKENESHKKEMNYYKKQYHNCKSRKDKALIYLGKCDWNDKRCFEKLINILNGSDEK